MDINEIANYIINNHHDCCLAYNSGGKLDTYYEDTLYEECLKFFTYEQLGICGCGRPEDTINVIKDLLNILDKYEKIRDDKTVDFHQTYEDKWKDLNSLCGVHIKDNDNYDGMLQFMMYVLDDKGFLEHGSGISGAWLSNEGKMLLYVLNNYDLDNL